MKRFSTLFSLLFFISTVVWAQKQNVENRVLISQSRGEVAYGPDTLFSRFIRPIHENPKHKYPLVVFLHGSGSRGHNTEAPLSNLPSILMDSLNRIHYPCYILIPQCPANDVWVSFPNFPNSLSATDTPTVSARLTIDMIRSLLTTEHIDPSMIYIIGYSMGGEGVFDLLWRNPDLFACGVPICGVADTSKAKLEVNIPLWVFHGSDDKVNPVIYSRMMVEAIKLSGGKPLYTEYQGVGHKCWDKAYAEPELLKWMFAQRNLHPHKKR